MKALVLVSFALLASGVAVADTGVPVGGVPTALSIFTRERLAELHAQEVRPAFIESTARQAARMLRLIGFEKFESVYADRLLAWSDRNAGVKITAAIHRPIVDAATEAAQTEVERVRRSWSEVPWAQQYAEHRPNAIPIVEPSGEVDPLRPSRRRINVLPETLHATPDIIAQVWGRYYLFLKNNGNT